MNSYIKKSINSEIFNFNFNFHQIKLACYTETIKFLFLIKKV